ncbi:type II toxin-antitoxin system RelE/ParE family toxin [Candidatus Poribacteria bacterium]|nr:type II toxin-antitoxin system RelE/ParE family toxin [Candidatus Poribacteria bacterium]
MKNSYYRDVYRLKVHQSYRMAYHVDFDARQITIVSVGTRENFYDRVRRCLR